MCWNSNQPLEAHINSDLRRLGGNQDGVKAAIQDDWSVWQ